MEQINDRFSHKADIYDKDGNRVNNVNNIANKMLTSIDFHKNMQIMDFGSGSGLLLERIAPAVSSITAVDISPSMNRVLEQKRDILPCRLEILEVDLTATDINRTFDGIISSMTLHHIEDIESIFGRFYDLIKNNGFLALADLDSEDGSFHTEDTGVHHYGFEREWLIEIAAKSGFTDVSIETVANVVKPHGEYPVFLLTAKK